MTVARYLERQGLLEECIAWLQHHYPKVKYFLSHILFFLILRYFLSHILFSLIFSHNYIFSPGVADTLWQAPPPVPPSQARQDQDEASWFFINLCNQNFKENHKITIFAISNQRWDQLILILHIIYIYICAKKKRCN